MKGVRHAAMSTLRLAYAAEFLIALIAVFVLWSEVGGQSHLDLMPWYIKLGLGAGAAFAVVKATAAAVAQENAWNGRTLKWLGVLLLLLVACGLASYYCHLYLEDDSDDQQDNSAAVGQLTAPAFPGRVRTSEGAAGRTPSELESGLHVVEAVHAQGRAGNLAELGAGWTGVRVAELRPVLQVLHIQPYLQP